MGIFWTGLADKKISTLLHGGSYFGRSIFYGAEKLVTLGVNITSVIVTLS